MANGTATLTQGLQQYTLVAGKTTALRMFADASTLANAHLIEVTVVRPGGSQVIASSAPGEFVTIPQSSAGPSIVVRLAGSLLPWIGIYTFDARIADGNGVEIASYQIQGANFLPTKDLRVMVSRLWSGTPTKPGEDEAAHAAMLRMSGLYPIRDGISSLDGDRNAGLRYNLDDNPMGPPNQDGHLCPLFAGYLNRPPTEDSIDVGITFRFPNPGEGSGGNANHHCPNQSLPFSVIVWGAPLANVFCQETAHAFGLEPPQDPHLDPVHGPHSKDVTIDAQDAELGFDIQYNQAWPQPTYDVMYWEGPDPEHPDPSIGLNSWDWEYLRQQIAALPSTGPSAQPIHLDTLTQFGSPIVGIAGYYAKDDDAQHVIVGTGDGNLTEVYWKPAQGVHQDVLTQFGSPIVGVGGYYAADDDTQHAIVGTGDGNLTEVYWKPAQGVHQDVLTQFGSPIVGIAGYYAKDDDAQHVIVGTADGTLTEVYWKPAQGVHQDVLTQFGSPIVGVGGYYAADDDTQHAIIATADGNLTEVYWKPAQGVHQDILARFNNIVGIAGYYAKDDDTQHVMVGTSDANLTEVYWKPAQGVHQDVLNHFTSRIVGIGGYYASDDDAQHAIVATSDGTLTEVYWKPS